MKKLNSHVRMPDAYRNYGCAILITIVVMILMNQLTCADREIVRLDGSDARDNQIIVAYPNGYSVMVKMIVVIIVMNCPKIVPFVIQKQISNVPITVAYQSKYIK